MSDPTIILANLNATPRQTATELGISIADAKGLEASGIIVAYGNRVTGKRGRPPIEWVVAGTNVSDSAADAVENAEARCEAHETYWRIADGMWRIREQMGMTEAHENAYYMDLAERKLAMTEAHGGIPALPSDNDLTITGRKRTTTVEPLDVPEVENVLVAA